MAGDYIKVDHDLPDKEEVISLAADPDLNYDEDEARLAVVILRLIRLWIWGDRHTEDGILHGIDASGCAQRLRGDIQFWGGVQSKKWIEFLDGCARIPNFKKRFGKSARSRLLSANRMRKYREKKRLRATPAQHVTLVAPTSIRINRVSTNVDTLGAQEGCAQQKTEKATAKKTAVAVGLPENLQGAAFEEAWQSWLAHRREIKKPMTDRAVAMQLKKLAGWGTERAIAAIEHSIAQDYQGIYEEELKHVGTTRQDYRRSARIHTGAYAGQDRHYRPTQDLPAEGTTQESVETQLGTKSESG